MVKQDQDEDIGWRFESTAETDPIDAADARWWKHGDRTIEFTDDHPIERKEYQAKYKANSWLPYDIVNHRNFVQQRVSFFPTTAVPFHMILGDTTTDASNIHTIDPITPGNEVPTFTSRSQSTGGYDTGGSPGDNDKIFSTVGCKANQLSGMIDLTQGFQKHSQTLSYLGINSVTPTFNAKHTTGTKFATTDATMGGTEVKDRFKYDTNWQFRWNSKEYDDEVKSLNYTMIQNLKPEQVSGQADIEFLTEGLYTLAFSGLVYRGKDSSIYDDYLAGTARTASFKIYSTATNYINVSWTNAVIVSEIANLMPSAKDEPFWAFSALARDVQVTSIDGLPDYDGAAGAAAEFYGETS